MTTYLTPEDVATRLTLSLDAARDLMHEAGAILVRRRLRLHPDRLDAHLAKVCPAPCIASVRPSRKPRQARTGITDDPRYAASSEQDRDRFRKRHYRGMRGHYPGMDRDLLALQNGKCAVCTHRDATDLDHDHKTGEPRGLLCGQCNSMLGMAGEDSRLLGPAAVAYLENPPARGLSCSSKVEAGNGTPTATTTMQHRTSVSLSESPQVFETTERRPVVSEQSPVVPKSSAALRMALIASKARQSRKRSPSALNG